MRARRRVGLGLVASLAVHLFLAGALLLRGERASVRESDPDAADWVEIAIVEDPAETTDIAATPDREPEGRPVSEPDPESESVREPSSEPVAEPTPVARASSTPEPAPTTEPVPPPKVGSPLAAATETGSPPPARSESGPPLDGRSSESAPPAGPVLDPRRAAEAVVLDQGPPPPPGPLDGWRPRKPPKTRSELRPDGLAGFKTDQGPFVARTRPDGSVQFDDRPNVRLHVPLPTPSNLARGVESWYESLAPGRGRAGRPAGGKDEPSPAHPDESAASGTVPVAGGSFDVTDGIMRGAGQDPYAARKMAFLDRTRAERMKIATAANSARLREALHRTRADLERIWRGPGSPAEKRELLFLVWDECAETGPGEVVHIARAVRGAIVAFIRRRLPAGSRHAFSADELAGYNRRRTSTARFEPYAVR